jgi:hypothetical protein
VGQRYNDAAADAGDVDDGDGSDADDDEDDDDDDDDQGSAAYSLWLFRTKHRENDVNH